MKYLDCWLTFDNRGQPSFRFPVKRIYNKRHLNWFIAPSIKIRCNFDPGDGALIWDLSFRLFPMWLHVGVLSL